MRFPITLKQNIVGSAQIKEYNNEVLFVADCEYCCEDILRLFAVYEDNILKIGVLEPSKNNHMCLSKRISNTNLKSNGIYQIPTKYYLDDGFGKYITSKPYETPFSAGKEHKYPFLLTACKLEKISGNWISYLPTKKGTE